MRLSARHHPAIKLQVDIEAVLRLGVETEQPAVPAAAFGHRWDQQDGGQLCYKGEKDGACHQEARRQGGNHQGTH